MSIENRRKSVVLFIDKSTSGSLWRMRRMTSFGVKTWRTALRHVI